MKEMFPGLEQGPGLSETLRGIFAAEPPKPSHAYTVEGSTQEGREKFAVAFASALLCENRSDAGLPLPCGVCRSCRNVVAGIHPDVTRIGTEEGKASIGVDTVRQIRSDVRIYPSEAERKIYLISGADRMTVQAQNAFLLTLEEPPSYAVILLLCEDVRRLLPTVKSRAPSLRLGYAGMPRESGADAVRAAAERFASVCSDRSRGQEAEAATAGDQKFTRDRDAAAALVSCIRSAMRDLLLLKRSPSAGLLFYSDREKAEMIADGYSSGRLIEILNAADEAAAALERNMNVRLALMKMLSDSGII